MGPLKSGGVNTYLASWSKTRTAQFKSWTKQIDLTGWLSSFSPAGFCLAAGTGNKRRIHQAERQRLADGHGVCLKLISIWLRLDKKTKENTKKQTKKLLKAEEEPWIARVRLLPPLRFWPRRSALRMFRPARVKKTHPSQRGWNILTKQVSLAALGSPLEEGRTRFVFQHRPETADGCTSEVSAQTHKSWGACVCVCVWVLGGVRLYANALACGHALSARQTRRLKHTSCVLTKTYLFEQFFFSLFFHCWSHEAFLSSNEWSWSLFGFCGFEH